MNIETFTVEALNKHQMWYALHNTCGSEVTLCRPTSVGYEPYNNATAYRMFNSRVVLGFNNAIEAQSQNGIVAIGDGFTEYVSTQPFERIKHILEIAPPNDQEGTFTFVDSQPVVNPNLDWRCDAGRYGPSPYSSCDGEVYNPISEKSVLLQYEPILSVPSVAHLIYLRRSNYEVERHEFLNNALTQMATATLAEMLVLLSEWAQVAEAPFNNSEEISQDAKRFLEAINFDSSIIDGYPAMQLTRFLGGDINARLRPDNPMAPSDKMINFIKTRVSHLSLASLISTDTGLWDLLDIAELEESAIHNNLISLHKQFFAIEPTENLTFKSLVDLIQTMPIERQPYIMSWVNSYFVADEIRGSFLG